MPDTLVRNRGLQDLVDAVARHLDAVGHPGEGWRSRAACAGVDPDIFFPRQGEPTSEAQAVCCQCPVRVECLAWALVTREKQGVWGGVAERTRRAIRRELARPGDYAASA